MKSCLYFLPVSALCLWMASAAPAHGATYCVDTNLNLATSLAASAASSEDDTIRIRTGSYSGLGAIDLEVRGALSISGGWGVNCLLRSDAATSTITGTSVQNFMLTQDNNDLSLSGLTFNGWSQVILRDVQQTFGPPNDEIRVNRSRFTNSLIGLFINAGSHNIVVENSRFDGHSNSGLNIFRGTGSFASADILLQHNTLSMPSVATARGVSVSAAAGVQAANIRIFNTVMDGHQFDLRISDQTVVVRNSFWTTQLFNATGGLAAGSFANQSGNPQLDATFRPIEPGSPLINTGTVLAGETPSTDFDGGPRVFGIRPDIGAYESNVAGVVTLTVTSAADSGPGSLRSAVEAANNSGGDALIQFNIPGGCPKQINLDTQLPTIAKSVRIEGYTQPDSEENSDISAFNGSVCVFLSGGNSVVGGLNLVTDAVSDELYISGLGFYGFTAHAILIAGPGKAQVRGSLFGTGLPLTGGGFDDTAIRIIGAPGSVIGGVSVADRNVIGKTEQVGVRISGAGPRTVRNNLIGSNRTGGPLPNGIGILVEDGDGDIIRNNTIVYNDAQGILLAADADAPQNTQILSNRIGAGTVDAGLGGNGGNAVRVTGGNGHEIRDNLIYNNMTDGIAVLENSRRVWISGNQFIGNMRLPVDLSPDGRNFNDLDIGQTGANDRQNFPALFTSRGDALSGTTNVQLSSAAGTYVAQIYASERCTPGGTSGFDDAARIVGTSPEFTTTCTIPTTNCSASIFVPISASPDDPLTGKFLSAVVWDEEKNTSEFSLCYAYMRLTDVFKDGFE